MALEGRRRPLEAAQDDDAGDEEHPVDRIVAMPADDDARRAAPDVGLFGSTTTGPTRPRRAAAPDPGR